LMKRVKLPPKPRKRKDANDGGSAGQQPAKKRRFKPIQGPSAGGLRAQLKKKREEAAANIGEDDVTQASQIDNSQWSLSQDVVFPSVPALTPGPILPDDLHRREVTQKPRWKEFWSNYGPIDGEMKISSYASRHGSSVSNNHDLIGSYNGRSELEIQGSHFDESSKATQLEYLNSLSNENRKGTCAELERLDDPFIPDPTQPDFRPQMDTPTIGSHDSSLQNQHLAEESKESGIFPTVDELIMAYQIVHQKQVGNGSFLTDDDLIMLDEMVLRKQMEGGIFLTDEDLAMADETALKNPFEEPSMKNQSDGFTEPIAPMMLSVSSTNSLRESHTGSPSRLLSPALEETIATAIVISKTNSVQIETAHSSFEDTITVPKSPVTAEVQTQSSEVSSIVTAEDETPSMDSTDAFINDLASTIESSIIEERGDGIGAQESLADYFQNDLAGLGDWVEGKGEEGEKNEKGKKNQEETGGSQNNMVFTLTPEELSSYN